MRLTIERMKTLVLAAAILLLVALVVFLAVGKWKNPFNRRDLPKRLGMEIQQEANGVTYTQAHGGHTLFKIHASKVVQLKQGNALLHDVKIEMYGADGSRVDRIEGSEFEYDQKAGTAKANGAVEITLMRPGTAPAIAPRATPARVAGEKGKGKPLATAAHVAEQGQIHVKTSGLVFDQKNGVAMTSARVDFSMAQGSGSSIGAKYDSQNGMLVLDSAVAMTTRRGEKTVELHAGHAEFEREALACRLHEATADYRDGQAKAGDATILFREDGSAVRLDAVNGFTLVTAAGSQVRAPIGSMDFNERNQPRHGHLEGGVTLDTVSRNPNQSGQGGRKVHGISPVAELDYTAKGELQHVHLARNVEIDTEEWGEQAGESFRQNRKWRSPIVELEFRAGLRGQAEPASIQGDGGVIVTSESQRGAGAVTPSRLAADDLRGEFGPGSQIDAMSGVGHASIEETTAAGTRQTATGDRLEAHFAPRERSKSKNGGKDGMAGEAQLQSAALDGNVVLVQGPVVKPGVGPEAVTRATAGRAVYEGAGEWLHLTQSPRVEDGALQLEAEKIDVSRDSGDAFAHGGVKATWVDTDTGKTSKNRAMAAGTGENGVGFGGNAPAHIISAEAQLHRATGEATFRGHARLWQQANSIAGAVMVLDRQKQTLLAKSTSSAEPVRAVLVGSAGQGAEKASGEDAGKEPGKGAQASSGVPSVILVSGGDFKYSDAEHKAWMRAGASGSVAAEMETATVISREVELTLLTSGNHAGKDGGQAQVDRMTARGQVLVTSDGRRGIGEKLEYSGETGEFVLTGTAAAPPRMIDPARGNVTGEALIFNSRDDSVSIEGGGGKAITETRAPK